jgi:hypothetical protein
MKNEAYRKYLQCLKDLLSEHLIDNNNSSDLFLNSDIFLSDRLEILRDEVRALRADMKSIQVRCPLGNTDHTPQITQLLVDQENKIKGLKEIRDFTKDAQTLTIIDPYIYSGSSKDKDKILKSFLKATRMNSSSGAKKIHIIYDKGTEKNKTVTGTIRKHILTKAALNKCQVTETATRLIHDRIWIVNNTKAIVVGSSLNGIGGRLCFILPLPNEDLNALMKYLKDNKLLVT